jgi:soluble lytic murein transglycosylase
MLSRSIVVFLVFLSFSGSASAATLYNFKDPDLIESVKAFRLKNYTGACDIAGRAQEIPARNFLLGIYLHKLEKWSDAAESFAKSMRGFDLLADYSLFYIADSLCRLGRYDEAAQALLKLKKDYPASPLIKAAAFLHADALYRKNDFSGALEAFQKYVESYPSGTKSLQAVYQAALCREALGDKEKAAWELRGIWLKYPGSPLALQAEKDLDRLKAENVAVEPYTPEEIFDRGVILYDLEKYKQAIQTFNSLSPDALPENLSTRVELKMGQSLFKARQYKDAEKILSRVTSGKDPDTICESAYWLARTLDRSKNELLAIRWFNMVADTFPKSEFADYALFHAAMIRKYRGENSTAIDTLGKLVSRYPSSVLASRALWEEAWIRYLGKDFKGAKSSFTQLLEYPSYREKSLYWLGKTEDAMGDKERADAVFSKLMEEFPRGFYSLQYLNKANVKNKPANPIAAASIPIPAGYERVKALIAFGLTDEAAAELASCRSKTSSRGKLLEIARLYWEMGDYRDAMGLFRNMGGNSSPEWNFSYPMAFSEHVSRYAVINGVPESLAYSIIRAESNFYPAARSPVGAVGLMQIMPGTAEILHKDKSGNGGAIQLTLPELNISLGMKHIKDLIRRYQGNLVLAVAAYNSGATPVDRWRRNFPELKNDEFIENIPYPETREYVKKVLASMEIYKSLYRLDAGVEKASATDPAKSTTDTAGLAFSSAK